MGCKSGLKIKEYWYVFLINGHKALHTRFQLRKEGSVFVVNKLLTFIKFQSIGMNRPKINYMFRDPSPL